MLFLVLCALASLLLGVDPGVHAQDPGGALLFDGIDDIAQVFESDDEYDLGAAVSLEAWVRFDALTSGAVPIGSVTPGGGGAWSIGSGISDVTAAIFTASTPHTHSAQAPGALQTGLWMHLAGSFDGNTLKVYVNGELQDIEPHPTPGDVSDVASLVMGRFRPPGSSLFLTGAVDEVRIWNVVRSDAEIEDSFNGPLSGSEPGLIGYYMFDEPLGQTIFDNSPQHNDGFLGSTPGPDGDDPERIESGAFGEGGPVPAVSHTGIIVTVIVLLAGSTAVLRWRRRSAA